MDEFLEQEEQGAPELLTAEEIGRLASRGELPDGMNSAERALWYAIRDILSRFRAGGIEKEKASELKAAAFALFEKDRTVLADGRFWIEYHAKFWQRIERAAREYTKNPSIETADDFYFGVFQVHRATDKHRGES